MQEQLGSIVAAAVGFTVLAIVASTNMRGQEAAIEAQQFMTAKKSAVAFSTMMARDFRNVGANYPAYPLSPDSVIGSLDTLSHPRVFEFIGQANRGLTPGLIRYEWDVAGTIAVKDSLIDYYQVKRFVNGQLAGMSTGAVTSMSIRLRDANGDDVLLAADTRQIEVSLRIVSSLGSGRIMDWVRWKEVIHPEALSRYDSVTS
jgi:hypothetical protein